MVPVAMLAQICTAPGQTFAISAFIPSIRESLGLSETWLTGAYLVGTVTAAIPLTLIGPMADRIGNRRAMSFVIVGLSLACMLASFAWSFASLLVAFLMLRFLGQGALTLLSANTTSMWFRVRLGRVSGLMNAGMACAFAVIPGMLLWCINAYGWRETYRGVGLVVLLIMLPLLALVYRNRPEDVGQTLDGLPPEDSSQDDGESIHPSSREVSLSLAQARRHRSFWILSLAMAAWGMIGTAVVFYLFQIGSQHGIPESSTAGVFTTFAGTMLVMQLVGGVMADRYRLEKLLAIGIGLLFCGISVLLVMSELWHLHVFATVFGLGQGLTVSVGATVWARYYGRKHLGKIRGLSWSASVAGSGCGPFVMGIAMDTTGSFHLALVAFAALLFPLTFLCLWATQPEAEELNAASDSMGEPKSTGSLGAA